MGDKLTYRSKKPRCMVIVDCSDVEGADFVQKQIWKLAGYKSRIIKITEDIEVETKKIKKD